MSCAVAIVIAWITDLVHAVRLARTSSDNALRYEQGEQSNWLALVAACELDRVGASRRMRDPAFRGAHAASRTEGDQRVVVFGGLPVYH